MLVIVHAEPAEAQAQTTLLEQDIWRQISPSITGSNSGAQQTDGLTLTAGQTYYLYVGTNAAFGKTVSVGTSGNDLFLLNELGVVTPGPKGPDAVLLQMTNTTSTYNPYYAVVRVTPTTTAPYYISTNSGGFGSPGSLSTGWVFPPGDTAGHPGVIGYHGAWDPSGSSTSEIAFAIKCCPQVQSESGIRQSQTSTLPANSNSSANSMACAQAAQGIGREARMRRPPPSSRSTSSGTARASRRSSSAPTTSWTTCATSCRGSHRNIGNQ